MIKHIIINIISILFLLPLYTKGAEKDSLIIIPENTYNNPAINFYRYSNSYSGVDMSFLTNDNNAYIMQQGKGENMMKVVAYSWIPLNANNKIWGKASYRNSTKKSVTWNETSDAHLLYPYIMADSVGGDLYGQTYSFEGGYAFKKNNIVVGASIAYRAAIEYRNIDPRPRNIISDLNVTGGIAWNMPTYILGASASYSGYNQKNDVDFYSQLGNAYIYTMTGLGNTYTRFDGTRTTSEYNGNTLNLSFQLRPVKYTGIWANAIYEVSNTTKRLTTENNIPLTVMNEQKFSIDATWLTIINDCHKIGININSEILKRNGKENLFNSGNGSSMEIIGNRNPYNEDRIKYGLQFLYSYPINQNYTINLKPTAEQYNMDMAHIDNNRRMEFKRSSLGAIIANNISLKKWSLNVNAAAYYQPVTSSLLNIEGITDSGIEKMIRNNFNVLTTNRNTLLVSANAIIPIKIYKSTIETGIQYRIEKYINNLGNNNNLEMNLGIHF